MEITQSMNPEPNYTKRQTFAFDYLRDRARTAHADGDGILVNSLCALALSQVIASGKKNQLKIDLVDLKWAYIFPLFWLIDDYMLRIVEEALKVAFSPTRNSEQLLEILRVYHFLVNQPLASTSAQLNILTEMNFEVLGEGKQYEDFVLLTHSIELIWFGESNQGAWLTLIDDWIERSPSWCRDTLKNLKKRLFLQTQLTSPNTFFPQIQPGISEEFTGDLKWANLWVYAMNNEWGRLDESIEHISATLSPASHSARLLFDFHHSNRSYGKFGESQEIGLTRRRLFTASSPLLVFYEIREARLSENLGRLFRQERVSDVSLRFHAFRLGMLSELSTLRLWDWVMWREAIKAQADAYLEAAGWTSKTSVAMAAHGIQLAVKGGSYEQKKNDAKIRVALNHLEFANEQTLSLLVEDLLAVYPCQAYQVYKALEDLSDLVPSKQWHSIAKWGLKFLESMQRNNSRGMTFSPLSYFAEIIKYMDADSTMWDVLMPEVIRVGGNSRLWHSDSNKRLLRAWLTKAPIEYAKKVGFTMVSAKTNGSSDCTLRLRLLRNVELAREELKHVFTPELCNQTMPLLELISLCDVPKPELCTQAKQASVQAIENMINKAVLSPGQKEFAFGAAAPYLPLAKIDWSENDLFLVKQLTETIDSPLVFTEYLPGLFDILVGLIRLGPPAFANHVLPRFQIWFEKPPCGQPIPSLLDITGNPFSVVHFTSSSLTDISTRLGCLALELFYKIGDPVAPVIAKWVHNSVLNPEPTTIPIMFYVGILAATRLSPQARTDLLATCYSLLSHLCLLHHSEPQYGDSLAEALLNLKEFVGKKEHPLVKRDTEAYRQTMEILIPKLSLLLIECSKSTNPNVRAAVAMFLRDLQKWMQLQPDLEQILTKLSTDNRARVRTQVCVRL